MDRRARLEALAEEPDPQRRRLVALGLLTDRLAEDGIEPILVGGGALAFYTGGGYASNDMDLALPADPAVDTAFQELGFAREGRYWYRADLDLLFEAPAPADLPGEDAPRTVVEVDGLRVVVLGVEDLLLDRLRAWVHWKSAEDGRWARRLALLWADRIDWEYLRGRTAGEDAERQGLEDLAAEAGR
ncbi:MAG: UbiD family decarboxylase [Thermoanaerobaculia bacterium]